MGSNLLRVKMLDLLKESEPLNTCQICRIIHGAKSKYDIKFCRPSKWDVRHDTDGFSRRGNNALYENCKDHSPGYGAIYSNLFVLERKGFLETRKELRSDPIVPTQKDYMRMWAIKGRLPSMKHFVKSDIMANAKQDEPPMSLITNNRGSK